MKSFLELRNIFTLIGSVILRQPIFYSVIFILFSCIEVIEDYIQYGFVSALCLFAITNYGNY